MSASTSITLPPVLDRLRRAWNAHDINTVTGCFHPGYKSIHPHHPERNTLGLDGVRRTWAHIFHVIPDFQVDVCRFAVMGDEVWTEWRWYGTPMAGAPFRAGGVIIFGIAGDCIHWARVYTETDPIAGPDIDAVLDESLSRATAQ